MFVHLFYAEALGYMAPGEGSVMGLEDLHGRVAGRGYDGRLGAEGDKHERAVSTSQVHEGDVKRCVAAEDGW